MLRCVEEIKKSDGKTKKKLKLA